MFPSEVLSEILNLKLQQQGSSLTFESLDRFNTLRTDATLHETGFKQPFNPLDYNHGEKHAFKFSDEYLAVTQPS